MTTIIGFSSKDSSMVTAIYMLSDSRISYLNSKNKLATFDYGTKIFPFRNSPDILGYSGTSLLGLSIISQLSTYLDYSTDFRSIDTSDNKIEILSKYLKESFKGFSDFFEGSKTKLYYMNRVSGQFNSYIFNFKIGNKNFHTPEKLEIKETSDLIFSGGSGKLIYKKYFEHLCKENGKFSRVIFSSFIEALKSQKDQFTGGYPQMVALLRKGNAVPIGIKYKNKLTLFGVEDKYKSDNNLIEYRNEEFEIISDETLKRLSNASVHIIKK